MNRGKGSNKRDKQGVAVVIEEKTGQWVITEDDWFKERRVNDVESYWDQLLWRQKYKFSHTVVSDDFDKNSLRGVVRVKNRLELNEEKLGRKKVKQCNSV